MYENPWIYNGEPFDSDQIGTNYGFVYKITNLTDGRMYIGKKMFYSSKTRQVNKKKKRTKVESDWQSYYGSNSELNKDVEVQGKDKFRREILHLCLSKGDCSYFEAKEQFFVDVLKSPHYYNQWIQCKIHGKHLKQ
jgi:Putative endonuclease segE, GIY-YIG domain